MHKRLNEQLNNFIGNTSEEGTLNFHHLQMSSIEVGRIEIKGARRKGRNQVAVEI